MQDSSRLKFFMVIVTLDGQVKCSRTRPKCKNILVLRQVFFPGRAAAALSVCPRSNRGLQRPRARLHAISHQVVHRNMHTIRRAASFERAAIVLIANVLTWLTLWDESQAARLIAVSGRRKSRIASTFTDTSGYKRNRHSEAISACSSK